MHMTKSLPGLVHSLRLSELQGTRILSQIDWFWYPWLWRVFLKPKGTNNMVNIIQASNLCTWYLEMPYKETQIIPRQNPTIYNQARQIKQKNSCSKQIRPRQV